MAKKSAILLSAVLACGAMVGAFTGCNDDKIDPNDPNKLEIYVYNAGYGYQWAEDILASFVQEDWVQAKYPGIENKSNVEHDEVAEYAKEMLTASKKVNNFDILMGASLEGKLGPDVNVLDLTEKVYNQPVPEGDRDVLYKDKLLDSYLVSAAYRAKGDGASETKYYQTNWASGMTGILYNETKLTALGYEVPNTTDELLAIMNGVKNRTPNNTYTQTTSFATYGTSAYANYLYYTWWAQYQTAEEYVNFFNGIDSATESRSSNIFKQEGLYEALSVLEKILHRDNGITWLNPNTGKEAYRETQNRVLLGNALFMANGDWVDNELKTLRDGLDNPDTVKLMPAPVLSSIVETLEDTSMTDATLSAVIDAVDAGETSYAGVSDADFARIKAAREVVYSIGPGHNAYIPSYATGVNPAVDFLLYMATDKAQQLYMKATNGASLPFDYTLKTEDSNYISALQQGRIDYFNTHDVNILPSQSSFPLVRYGNLSVMSSGMPLENFTSGMSKGSYSSVAELCFKREIQFWTENENAVWNNCLRQAGMLN